MTDKRTLTAKEFTIKAGIPASTVTQLLRDGKIKGEKKSGKWIIPESELNSPAIQSDPKPASSEPDAPTASESYSVAEFVRMTYLTEKGVAQWLKSGKLCGEIDDNGQWRVFPANLDDESVKRLLRKT
jgi:predicted site-specific integrase-resolvase